MRNNEKLNNRYIENSNDDDQLGIIIFAVMSFLPMIGIGNYLRIILMFGLFCRQISKKRLYIPQEIKSLLIMMITGCIIPAIVVIVYEGNIRLGYWLHEFIRIIFYCMMIPVIYNYRSSFDYVVRVCIVVLTVNCGIQVMQWQGIGNINALIYQYYSPKDQVNIHLLLATYTGKAFRAGSIFINPNVCMVVPCTVLGVLIQKNLMQYSIWNYIWMGVAMLSILLTGSRTAFILSFIVIGYCTYKDKNAGMIKWLFPIILGVGFLMNIKSFENYRALDLASAMEGSGNAKISGFLGYLSLANIIYLITGCCGSNIIFGLDNEWGYIYMFYGVLGLTWYIGIIKLFQRNKDILPILTIAVTLVICLIGCTATIILCMPLCTFFCMISIMKYHINEEKINLNS